MTVDRCRDETPESWSSAEEGSTVGADTGAGGSDPFVGLPALWELGPSEVVSVVGGGGKTSLIERLARGYEAEGSPVVLATTTKVLPPDPEKRPLLLGETAAELAARLAAWWEGRGSRPVAAGESPVVGTRVLANGKLDGISPEWVPTLRDLPWVGAVLVEADGAARLPLKAPAAWEPVIPVCTSLTIVVAGLDAQDVTLDADHVHRPELLAALMGLGLGQRLPSGRLCEALLAGYEPKLTAGSRMLVFLNKLDVHAPSPALVAAAATAPVEVWAGTARGHGAVRNLRPPRRRPAAVILAAGLGTRMAAVPGAAHETGAAHEAGAAPEAGAEPAGNVGEGAIVGAAVPTGVGAGLEAPATPGVSKVLQRVGRRSLVGRAAQAVLGCPGVAEVVVVVGADGAAVEAELRRESGIEAGRMTCVANPEPENGQASSLRLGVAALPPGRDPLVVLADQPWVSAGTLGRLLSARAEHPRAAGIGLATSGVVGPPVVLHCSLRPQIAELTGDAGARTLLRRYGARVVAVQAEGDEACDVDDVGDLQRARAAAVTRAE